MKKIRIKTDKVTKQIELNDSETARAIWEALPLQGMVNRWGDEIYLRIPVEVALASDARAEMAVGEVAYWPPGQAFCIFWGPTPVSMADEPRAASEVNVLGKVLNRPEELDQVQEGQTMVIERA